MSEEHGESELREHLYFVYGAAICLVIGQAVRWLRPEQTGVAALWEMAGAALSAIPIIIETLEGARSKAAENSEFYINQFILLAVAACFVTGQYVTGALVAIILMVGHVFEDRSMLGVNEAINSLLNLSRARGRRLVDGVEEEVDAELLREPVRSSFDAERPARAGDCKRGGRFSFVHCGTCELPAVGPGAAERARLRR